MKKLIFILLVMAFACEPAKKVEKEIVLREDLGGYVFYVSPDGEHGLVAATQDQSTGSNWNDAFGLVNNNANHDVAGANFTDWRLPTKDELNMMYLKKDEIGGFANNNYWSSGQTEAWVQYFGNGAQNSVNAGFYSIRAVRAF